MIKNQRTRLIKIKPERRIGRHYPVRRSRTDPNLYDNYRLLLQLYVISKNDIIVKKKIKTPPQFLRRQKNSADLVSYIFGHVTTPFNTYLLKVNKLKSRIFSAIEISYQSLVG